MKNLPNTIERTRDESKDPAGCCTAEEDQTRLNDQSTRRPFFSYPQ